MSEYTVFPNAPITQAIINMRLELPDSSKLQNLEVIYESIKDDYPVKQYLNTAQFNVTADTLGNPGVFQSSIAQDGLFFQTEDRTRVLETKLDGFTLSQLKPYKDWESFRDEARKLWQLYSDVVKPLKITRLATRYINRIEIPESPVDFKEYLLTTPEIAPQLPQMLSEFFMRLVMPQPDEKTYAIITQTIDAIRESELITPYIFDIDVFQLGEWQPESEEIWEVLEKLRVVKNEIFFKSITDKTKGLFQ